MATRSVSRARTAPRSRRTPPTRCVSPAAMRRAILAIADRHFGQFFEEVCSHYAAANPAGRSYVRESLLAMRKVLKDHERRAQGGGRRS